MRIQRNVKPIWIWLPSILVLAAFVIFMIANMSFYISFNVSFNPMFGFGNFKIRLLIPLVFPVLLVILHKTRVKGLHATMAVLNFAVILLSVLYSLFYLLYYFDVWDSYSKVLSYFSSLGSISDMVLFFFSDSKVYPALRLCADNMTLIAHFTSLYCFIHFAQQDANPALYPQRRN